MQLQFRYILFVLDDVFVLFSRFLRPQTSVLGLIDPLLYQTRHGQEQEQEQGHGWEEEVEDVQRRRRWGWRRSR